MRKRRYCGKCIASSEVERPTGNRLLEKRRDPLNGGVPDGIKNAPDRGPGALSKLAYPQAEKACGGSDHFRSFEVRSKEMVPTIACWP